jgi:glutathione S-transferase
MKPILWHLRISHYSEKARWALAWKDVEHERRAPMPSSQVVVSAWLTRGQSKTFPVMRLDGEVIPDSTAIIGALEARYPEPSLYPEGPAERRRALDLEEYFDEELGPAIRQLVWYEMSREPQRFVETVGGDVPQSMRRMPGSDRMLSLYAKTFTSLRYGAGSAAKAAESRAKVVAALDRLEAELDGNEYLVGDAFSVADLTAASLFYPLVLPAEGPQALAAPPPAFEEFRAPLADRPGYRWVAEMFHRHR